MKRNNKQVKKGKVCHSLRCGNNLASESSPTIASKFINCFPCSVARRYGGECSGTADESLQPHQRSLRMMFHRCTANVPIEITMTGLFYFQDTLVGSLAASPGPARSEYLSFCVHQRLYRLPVFVHIFTSMVSPVVQ